MSSKYYARPDALRPKGLKVLSDVNPSRREVVRWLKKKLPECRHEADILNLLKDATLAGYYRPDLLEIIEEVLDEN
ncbi:hypothetical protein [Sporolituus thermophilus]|uniref:Uncharacterized protein n=1 Tax=Sporolituus thermophilus DSM 23256 TaxID=1123285 RepID=A0A1G7MVG2_9FIRM|nr:hypothetical protein [Sporolituus thermophilus]SDF65109.1 hypothetical protein SAMN05660235_02300 [Sporolituus thermophilus DSM 23256]